MQPIPFGAFPPTTHPSMSFHQMQGPQQQFNVKSNYKAGLMEDIKNLEVLVFLSLETNTCADQSYRINITDANVAAIVSMHKEAAKGSVQEKTKLIQDLAPYLNDPNFPQIVALKW
jgi:hypothetical protein